MAERCDRGSKSKQRRHQRRQAEPRIHTGEIPLAQSTLQESGSVASSPGHVGVRLHLPKALSDLHSKAVVIGGWERKQRETQQGQQGNGCPSKEY